MAKGPATGLKTNVVRSLVERIEKCHDQIESSLGTHRNRCGQIKRTLEGLFEEAKTKGVPVKGLRAYITGRQKMKAARRTLENLPPDEQMEVALLAEAMGDDLPLFKFARSKELPQDLEALTTH